MAMARADDRSPLSLRERVRVRADSGFTLVELLLVLVLLAMMAALAWPAIERPWSKHRLRAAADRVRTEWCLARIEAIRSGKAYVFQYTLGGRSFRTQRRPEGPDDEPWAWERSETAKPAAAGLAAPEASAVRSTTKILPEHVVFGAMTINRESAAATAGVEPPLVAPAGGGWSDAVCFYPDGTTSNVRLVLLNDRGSRVELTLRGLTGTVIVGEVQSQEERLP
jgi:prepilin-type N-terminal cleavage/methylation domain-containing protein